MKNPFTKVLALYPHDRQASHNPITYGWVKNIYPHAIEYTTMDKGTRGYVFLMGGMVLTAVGAFGAYLASDSVFPSLAASGFDDWFGYFVVWPSFLIFSFLTLFFPLYYGRLEFFRPIDLPIIFDRQRRKVYRMEQNRPLGWLSTFKPWPIRHVECDWDDIVALHGVVTYTTGNTVKRQHQLALLVRDKNPGDFTGEVTPDNLPPFVDGFMFGNASILSEITTPSLWEHVRRYMNQNGPPLPPGDELADTTLPSSWWQSFGAVSLFGPGYMKRWADHPYLMTLFHVFSPLFLPIGILMATINRISYLTAYPVPWPDEVLQKVGKPLPPPMGTKP